MALQHRLLPVLRTAAWSPVHTYSATRAFSTTFSRLADPQNSSSSSLPNLPPRKEVDPFAKTVRPKRAPHPYDATKSSIADLIGASMTTTFASPDLVGKPARLPISSSPSTGRTVHVAGPVNVARAFKLVEQRCSANRVAAISSRQRFHERPGLKRKRLRMSRWRARFKTGFHATVTRVRELARQGW
ncbi:uncharacterized protein DNG_01661 [Cephalotrichum gorgonifer]|uniref:Ribosomal protein S21 n=1 Tax=Cephalotrichum gorgonifer TaxID=2041049 RepID=A0AAE8SRV5_9PEZI|nr:uncharacterized protein DNG_01661 [Cephalotrichum gorgonifer]